MKSKLNDGYVTADLKLVKDSFVDAHEIPKHNQNTEHFMNLAMKYK